MGAKSLLIIQIRILEGHEEDNYGRFGNYKTRKYNQAIRYG